MSRGPTYRRVLTSFWTDPDVRRRRLTSDQKLLLLYLFTNPHTQMSGLYWLPLDYAAAETGLDRSAIEGAIKGVLSDFVTYDPETEEVLVHRLLRHNAGDSVRAGDNRVKAVENQVADAHSKWLVCKLIDLYPDWPMPDPPEGASKGLGKGLPSDLQASHAVTHAVTGTEELPLGASADAPDEGGVENKEPDPWPTKPPKNESGQYDYPAPFEEAWTEYPDRDGTNPKLGAYKAFRARVKAGDDPEELVAAARHYRQHQEARGNDGTSYVQQAATFYGPSEPFREFVAGWEPPPKDFGDETARDQSRASKARDRAASRAAEHRRQEEERAAKLEERWEEWWSDADDVAKRRIQADVDQRLTTIRQGMPNAKRRPILKAVVIETMEAQQEASAA